MENLQQGNGTSNNDAPGGHELNLPILDSYNNDLYVQVEKGPSSAAECHPSLAERRKRIAGMSMADAINLMHMTRGDAAKLLNISCSSLKRLCKRNGLRWPGRKVCFSCFKVNRIGIYLQWIGFVFTIINVCNFVGCPRLILLTVRSRSWRKLLQENVAGEGCWQ